MDPLKPFTPQQIDTILDAAVKDYPKTEENKKIIGAAKFTFRLLDHVMCAMFQTQNKARTQQTDGASLMNAPLLPDGTNLDAWAELDRDETSLMKAPLLPDETDLADWAKLNTDDNDTPSQPTKRVKKK